jgi:anti-sigma-K factor RskA
MDDLYELYLLGVLETDQAAEIALHLRENCEYCQRQTRASSEVVGVLAAMVEVTPPPPKLRERVLSIATPVNRKRSGWPLAFALACAASLALLVWNANQRTSLDRSLMQLQEVSRQRNELRAAIAILSETDTRTVQFGKLEAEPHGRVFVSQSGGVVFVGGQLPQLASGKTFEFWLVPAKGNPQAAGLFQTNSQGVSVNVLAKAINPAEFLAVAVSVEPAGGSPQPTSKPILIIPLA